MIPSGAAKAVIPRHGDKPTKWPDARSSILGPIPPMGKTYDNEFDRHLTDRRCLLLYTGALNPLTRFLASGCSGAFVNLPQKCQQIGIDLILMCGGEFCAAFPYSRFPARP
jgi:hypothetical protein